MLCYSYSYCSFIEESFLVLKVGFWTPVSCYVGLSNVSIEMNDHLQAKVVYLR
jgi:hypothetical protein